VLSLFSAEDGLLTALLRQPGQGRPTKPNARPAPDLFDLLALDLQPSRTTPSAQVNAQPHPPALTAVAAGSSVGGGLWFVREHRLLLRHAAIGRDYPTLAAASRLARLITRNPIPQDSRSAVHTLLNQAFAAFSRPGTRPDLVFFKSLYCLARDEGLPLKQHWLPTLPAPDRTLVAASLSLPADTHEAPPATDLLRLTKRLETYLANEADMQFA